MVRIVRSEMLDAMFPDLIGVSWELGLGYPDAQGGAPMFDVPGYPNNGIVPELLEKCP
jgi:hypothetical protein